MFDFFELIGGFIIGVLAHKHVWDWVIRFTLPYKEDVDLFSSLKELLEKDGTIELLHDHDFGNSFPAKSLKPLESFCDDYNPPNKYFLSNSIEKKKIKLLKKIENFLSKTNEYVYANPPHFTRLGIPKEQLTNNPEQFFKAKKELNDLATEVYNEYIKFEASAKKALSYKVHD